MTAAVDESGRVTQERLGNNRYTQRVFDRGSGVVQTIRTGSSAGDTSMQNLSMDTTWWGT